MRELSCVTEVSVKLLASAVGGKSAEMMPPASAERFKGYRIGGISPFGQQRRVSTLLDHYALRHKQIYVNAGQRGLQLFINPADIVRVTEAIIADITQAR